MAKPNNEFISWVALFVAIIALVVALSGSDAFTQLDGQARRTAQTTEVAAEDVTADARKGIERLVVEAEQAAEVTGEEVADDVAVLREELRASYENAEQETAVAWEEIDQDLEDLEARLRAGTATVINNLQTFLEGLENRVVQ